eukprot:Amastigsp_a339857_74.p4 type:complete len:162 gc:universal Amastigsp_a339857_74:1281-796(-)
MARASSASAISARTAWAFPSESSDSTLPRLGSTLRTRSPCSSTLARRTRPSSPTRCTSGGATVASTMPSTTRSSRSLWSPCSSVGPGASSSGRTFRTTTALICSTSTAGAASRSTTTFRARALSLLQGSLLPPRSLASRSATCAASSLAPVPPASVSPIAS